MWLLIALHRLDRVGSMGHIKQLIKQFSYYPPTTLSIWRFIGFTHSSSLSPLPISQNWLAHPL